MNSVTVPPSKMEAAVFRALRSQNLLSKNNSAISMFEIATYLSMEDQMIEVIER